MKQGTFFWWTSSNLRLDRPPPRGATHLRLERNGRRVDRAGLVSARGFLIAGYLAVQGFFLKRRQP